jgi:enoyl-CoA hydratase
MMLLRIEKRGPIAELILARPPVNAMNGQLLTELAEAFANLERDDAVRGVLVRGEGKCLSAGLDLAEVAALDRPGVEAFFSRFDAAFRAALAFDKPMAVAVDGHAIAGGMVLALSGDFVAVGRGAHKVGLTELAVGVAFPRIAFEIVRLALPPRALRVLVNGAAAIPVTEAFDLGFGDVMVDDARAEGAGWLERAASRPLDAFRLAKQMHRAEAIARSAAVDDAERRAHLQALLGARETIAAALAATKQR